MSIPVAERGYPRPDLLADTTWLAGRLEDPTVCVVDARSDEDYANGHIPGAVSLNGFSLAGLRAGPEMPPPDTFAALAGSLGIDEGTTVVVYSATDSFAQMAGMVAWAFLYYGHAPTRLLDGGLTKWTAENRPLSDVASAPAPRTFPARLDEGVLCTLAQAKAAVDDDNAVFWDVRTTEEFDGSQQGWNPPPRLGHMPGAVHLNYTELFDPDDGTLKPAAELTHLLGERGITPESAVSTY